EPGCRRDGARHFVLRSGQAVHGRSDRRRLARGPASARGAPGAAAARAVRPERADRRDVQLDARDPVPGPDDDRDAARAPRRAAPGSGPNTNDVDGTTVLTSPRFMASGFTHLELDYARWYADLGTQDVHLLVQVSNDDGATWTQLENLANDNIWRTLSFDLEN